MLKSLLRKPLFWLGFLYIFVWLLGSFLYGLFWHNHIPLADLMYNSKGNLTAKPPYPPNVYPPLGTDDFGQNMLVVLLTGAKFTLGFGLLIALGRVIIAGILGVLLRVYIPKMGQAFLSLFEGLSYFPVALLAFFLLHYVLFQDAQYHQHFTYSFWQRIWIDVVILIGIAIPPTAQTIFNETDNILKKDFIESAQVLGASRFHVLWRHVRLFLSSRLVLIFMREMIQVLLLMAHLGVFGIAIGGVLTKENYFHDTTFYAVANDWAGLTGLWWEYILNGYAYIPFIPIIALTLSILAVKAILVAAQSVNTDEPKRYKKTKQEFSKNIKAANQIDLGHAMFHSVSLKNPHKS